MILTEDEAIQKACPFSHGASLGVQPCTASACMGWRWIGWRDQTNAAIFTGKRRFPDDEQVGTCGLKPPMREGAND